MSPREPPQKKEGAMRKVLAVLGFLLLAATLYLAPPCLAALLAQSGCCKTRNAYNERWSQVSWNFERCQQENQRGDGDDVFQPRGLVWWDLQCR
jgi:hypothetical protein